MKNNRFFRALPLLLPLAYLLLAVPFGHKENTRMMARDATYFYLANTFSVALREPLYFFTHPGIPLQLWGGALNVVKHAVAPESSKPFRDELIEYQGRYLHWLAWSAIWLNALALAFVGVWALPRLGVVGTLVAQASFFSMPSNWNYVGLYQPEAVLIFVGCAVWGASLVRRRSWVKQALLFGSLLALKIYYAGYLVLAFLERTPKRVAKLLVGAMAAMLVWWLAFLPWRTEMFLWYLEVVVRQGDYDSGAVGLPRLGHIWERQAQFLWQGNLPLWSFLPGILCMVAVTWCSRGNARLRRQLFGYAAAMAASLGIYVWKSTHDYYVLPMVALLPVFLATFWQIQRKRRWPLVLSAFFLAPAFVGPSLVPGTCSYVSQIGGLRSFNEELSHDVALYEDFVRAEHECAPQFFSGVVPVGITAVATGMQWAHKRWPTALDGKYPNVFFTEALGQVHQFGDRVIGRYEWNFLLNQQGSHCVVYVNSVAAAANPRAKLLDGWRVTKTVKGNTLELRRLDRP